MSTTASPPLLAADRRDEVTKWECGRVRRHVYRAHMTFLREFSEVAVVERVQWRGSVADLVFHAVANVLVRMRPGS